MAQVPLSATICIRNERYTIRDLLRSSKWSVRSAGELAWTVGAYADYLTRNETWTNRFGETMSIAALTSALLQQDDQTCGGTHSLCALARLLSNDQLADAPGMSQLMPRHSDAMPA